LAITTSCCGIEFMATMASHYDLARFGSERVSFLRVTDMLMVMGTISKNGTYLTSGIRANVRTKMGWLALVLPQEVFSTPTLLFKELTKLYRLTFTYQVVLKTGANRRWCNEITRKLERKT
jgi:hypothetical protein